MLVAFPVIFISRALRRRVLGRRNAVQVSGQHTRPSDLSRGRPVQTSRLSRSQASNQQADVTHRPPEVEHSQAQQRTPKKSRGFFVLGLLTISVTVCWAPAMVFYTLGYFIQVQAPTVYEAVVIIYSFQTMLDPILFTMALKSLRVALRHTFSCPLLSRPS